MTSGGGCCGMGPRATVLSSAVFTLLQALVWTGLAGYGLYMHDGFCPRELSDLPTVFTRFIYLFYLFNIDCVANAGSPGLPIEPLSTVVRTRTFTYSYTVVSGVWAALSVLVLVTIGSGSRGRGAVLLCSPWLALTAGLLVLDVVTAVIYGKDIANLNDLLDDVHLTPEIIQGLGGMWYLYASSTLMVLLALRFVVLWVVNLVVFICGACALAALNRDTLPKTRSGQLQPAEPRHLGFHGQAPFTGIGEQPQMQQVRDDADLEKHTRFGPPPPRDLQLEYKLQQRLKHTEDAARQLREQQEQQQREQQQREQQQREQQQREQQQQQQREREQREKREGVWASTPGRDRRSDPRDELHGDRRGPRQDDRWADRRGDVRSEPPYDPPFKPRDERPHNYLESSVPAPKRIQPVPRGALAQTELSAAQTVVPRWSLRQAFYLRNGHLRDKPAETPPEDGEPRWERSPQSPQRPSRPPSRANSTASTPGEWRLGSRLYGQSPGVSPTPILDPMRSQKPWTYFQYPGPEAQSPPQSPQPDRAGDYGWQYTPRQSKIVRNMYLPPAREDEEARNRSPRRKTTNDPGAGRDNEHMMY